MTGSGTVGDPYIISDVDDLQDMASDLTAYYELANDIDATETSGWNAGEGFLPIGINWPNAFTGHFDGKEFIITGLFIDTTTRFAAGLFGYCRGGATFANVGIADCDITTSFALGGTSYAVGALIGYLDADAAGTVLSRCYSTGAVVNSGTTGGAFDQWAGGLIGDSASTALGNLTISNCYSVCSVTGSPTGLSEIYHGGFSGSMTDINITNCYSAGLVACTPAGPPITVELNGFAYDNGGNVETGCFWDTETSGQTTGEGTGKTTIEMKSLVTFRAAGWAIAVIWNLFVLCTNGYPCLIDVTPCCMSVSNTVDSTIIGNKVSLEAIRNIEMVYGGRFYIGKSGNAVYESRYHRNV